MSVAEKLSNNPVAFAFYGIGSAFCTAMSLFSVTWLSWRALGAVWSILYGAELPSLVPPIKWLPESLVIGLDGPFSSSHFGFVVSSNPGTRSFVASCIISCL